MSALKLEETLQTIELSADMQMSPGPDCVGIGKDLAPHDVLRHAVEYKFHHVLQRNGLAFDREMNSSRTLAQQPDLFRQLPIATILTPEDLSAQSERAVLGAEEFFNTSSQKRPALASLNKAMELKGLPRTLVDDVILVADEMFTNAVYNAPFVDFQTQNNPGINRQSVEVQFTEGKYGRLFLAHDEMRLVVGCEDPFGTLNVQRWLARIKETIVRGPAASMNFGPGGAGLGSYIIFNAGASLYFGVWPGVATIVCCVIPMGMTNRKRLQLPKHLHWIQREGGNP